MSDLLFIGVWASARMAFVSSSSNDMRAKAHTPVVTETY